MKKIILYIVLAASLSLNIAVFMRIYFDPIRRRPEPKEFRKPENREMFLQNRKLMQEMHNNLRKTERELGNYLSSENYNEEEARKLIDRIIKSKMEIEKQIGENILKMRRNQTCEEACKFFKREEPHPRRRK